MYAVLSAKNCILSHVLGIIAIEFFYVPDYYDAAHQCVMVISLKDCSCQDSNAYLAHAIKHSMIDPMM